MATELAKAYVQIVPSAEGISGSCPVFLMAKHQLPGRVPEVL